MPSAIPHPSEHTSWPSWFYPPETDPENPAVHGKIFAHHDDVPEGWAADYRAHGVNLNREPPPPPADSGLTRNELKAALTKLGVAHTPTAAKAELQKLFDAARHDPPAGDPPAPELNLAELQAELDKRDIPFEADADQAALQALLDEALEIERLEEGT